MKKLGFQLLLLFESLKTIILSSFFFLSSFRGKKLQKYYKNYLTCKIFYGTL